jgi:bifunctional enzyme CysN/CysC
MTVQTQPTPAATQARQRMDIVVIGHVDHGKSTLVGRLLADTGSLPEGRLEAVQAQCRRTARPFEYAFLLDALKDEQAQGITIDTARCFFKTARRDYIIIDAPGHMEFLKNMISGAARAEAGLLVIDAKEGVRENSRRHGYLMSLLGIRQIAVCVNKMDLVGFDRAAFESIRAEYTAFLDQVGLRPLGFVPLSAMGGDNLATRSERMPWYDGPTVLKMVDAFVKEPAPTEKPLRLPVQDVYKFTEEGDERRIIAGRVETGSLAVGDEVVFLPSGKRSTVASLEEFNAPPRTRVEAGQSAGITLSTQLYVRPGELMTRADQAAPRVSSRLRVTLFWMGRQPMVKGKRYKMKIASLRVPVWLTEIASVMDAGDLSTDTHRREIARHDVAECVLETFKPVACDLASEIPQTGRFVLIDDYEIAGGGIILRAEQAAGTLAERHVAAREKAWERSTLVPFQRQAMYRQRATLVVVAGPIGTGKIALAKTLEEQLFRAGRLVYYLGLSNSLLGASADPTSPFEREEFLRRLGEVAHLFTDAGLILIATVSDLDDDELDVLETLNKPGDLLVVSVGESRLSRRQADLALGAPADTAAAVERVKTLLAARTCLPEYEL